MLKKTTWAMCMVGKYPYEGIVAALTNFFEPTRKYTKLEIKTALDDFYDNTSMRLIYCGDDYDFITFMRNKIYFLERDQSGYYSLSKNGEHFRDLLLADEAKFKKALIKWIYDCSRTRFRSFSVLIERLKQWWTEKGPILSNKNFQDLIESTLGKNKFNEGVLCLLESLGLYKRTLSGFRLNGEIFNVIFSKHEQFEVIYSLLKNLSTDNKILHKTAIAAISTELGTDEADSSGWLEELQKENMVIIRSTRGGKYIEL